MIVHTSEVRATLEKNNFL